MTKRLDYKTTKEYFLTIKVEDNAPEGRRRSVTVSFAIEVTFHSSNTEDLEVKKEIELIFPDMDYDTVILGKESNFIAALSNILSSKHPGVYFVHFKLRKGSVIAAFDMITTQSNVTNVLDQLVAEVTSTKGLTVTFNGQNFTTNKMQVDNEIYNAASHKESEDSAMVSRGLKRKNKLNMRSVSPPVSPTSFQKTFYGLGLFF